MAVDNVAGKVAALRQSVQQNQRLRADAETRLALSRQKLETIDNRLKELGLNPDNVDEELKDLDQQFEVMSAKLTVELQTEANSYNAIIEQTKPALGEK